jgi:hypothetical protein
MKELQLWLASVLLCCAVMGQSSIDHTLSASSSEVNSTFSFFTVTLQEGRTILHWSASQVKQEDFFIVEKSTDAVHFEMLSALGAAVGLDSVYTLVDNSIGTGTVSYRIHVTGKDGKEYYSKTLNINSISVTDFRFYPNPVDKLLIIRSSHALNIQILDMYGTVWFGQEVDSGMQIVNVSALQKGTYILKATDKATNSVISEELVKNN